MSKRAREDVGLTLCAAFGAGPATAAGAGAAVVAAVLAGFDERVAGTGGIATVLTPGFFSRRGKLGNSSTLAATELKAVLASARSCCGRPNLWCCCCWRGARDEETLAEGVCCDGRGDLCGSAPRARIFTGRSLGFCRPTSVQSSSSGDMQNKARSVEHAYRTFGKAQRGRGSDGPCSRAFLRAPIPLRDSGATPAPHLCEFLG